MINLKSILVLAISIALFSCSKDEEISKPLAQTLEVKTFSNLFAPSGGGQGQPVTGDFVKFSFSTGQIVTTGDNWDIAFRSTTILVNGGVGALGQPARTGNGAAAIVTGVFEAVKVAPDDNLFFQDSATGNAIPAVSSVNGWYTYTPATNLITPNAGRVLVFKTHNGKYAKMEILNYYQNAPANPTGTEPSRYYKFNFVYQANGTKNF